MLVLGILGAALPLIWFLSFLIMMASSPHPRPLPSAHVPRSKKRNVLLVIAHPDDESMFFAPTLLSLASLGCYNVRILCLSNGNAEGLGAVRQEEMLSACTLLKVMKGNVEVVDDPALQDGHKVVWSQDLILHFLDRASTTHDIDTIITFDDYGVSGHPNHVAVYRGVCGFLLENCKHKDKPAIEAWMLESVNILKKYSGPVYALLSTWNVENARESHRFYSKDVRHSIAAMRQHASQWLWYRRMFVIFSYYTYMNRLRKVDV